MIIVGEPTEEPSGPKLVDDLRNPNIHREGEEDLAAQWEREMGGGRSDQDPSDPPLRVLNQDEIDSLLGFDAELEEEKSGVRYHDGKLILRVNQFPDIYAMSVSEDGDQIGLYTVEDAWVLPASICTVRTGIALDLPDGFYAEILNREEPAEFHVIERKIRSSFKQEIALIIANGRGLNTLFVPKGTHVADMTIDYESRHVHVFVEVYGGPYDSN